MGSHTGEAIPASKRSPRRQRVSPQRQEHIITIFKRLAMERVTVPYNGRPTRMTRAEAILLKNYNAAVQGDKNARANVWRALERSGQLLDQTDPAKAGKPIFLPEKVHDLEQLLAEEGASIIHR